MDKKHILIIAVLVIVIAVLTFSIVGVMNQEKVHTISLDVASFNCSDDINFTLKQSEYGFYEYGNENWTHSVKIMKYNESDSAFSAGYGMAMDKILNYPSSVVDGVIVYNTTANVGNNIGDLRHMAVINNNDKNIDVVISTPSVDETVLIANTFTFK